MDSEGDKVETPHPDLEVEAYVGSMRRMSVQQLSLSKALSGMLKPQLEKQRKLQKRAKSMFTKLSAVPSSRRADVRYVPARASAAEKQAIHHAAMRAGLAQMAERYQGQLRLDLTADELRELGINPEATQGAAEVPMQALNRLLETRGVGGCDLLRTRTLLDSALPAAERVRALGDLSLPAHDRPAPGKTPLAEPNTPARPMQVAEAEQLILDSVAAKLKEQQGSTTGDVDGRPDAPAVSKAIEALELTGGPADVTAFHDFKVLQLAFPNVWTEAFDDEVLGLGAALYQQAVQHYAEMDQTVPPIEAIEDIETLASFIEQVSTETGITPSSTPGQTAAPGSAHGAEPATGGPVHQATPATSVELWNEVPIDVVQAFSDLITSVIWRILSASQKLLVHQQASVLNAPFDGSPAAHAARQQAHKLVEYIVAHPAGPGGRLSQLMYELNQRLLERYSFEVFAPGSYNFGVLLTYRQKWEPLTYQAGDLVSTIPLAPGEVRRYSKRRVNRSSRAEKEIARSSASRSQDMTQTERAEAEIMRKTVQATNFSMSSQGTFSIAEMVDITASNSFGTNQSQDSADTKKDFHEATLKSAEQYRKENSLEVDSTMAAETDELDSGEISNPNNEITVTYLFYELQRRYRVSEQAHRAQAVILVAQDVPAPNEINEAFLVANQWILSRFLLDESLRPALSYLTSGLAGDDVSLNVLRAHWLAQKSLLDKLEQAVTTQLGLRDALRTALAQAVLGQGMADAMNPSTTQKVATGILSGGVSLLFPGGADNVGADVLEARRKATETRLQYVEDAVNELQGKLQSATESYSRATQEYADALGKTYARRVAIDQLRVHVKDNILHYMHAIWDSEPPDQRFFRLHERKISLPEPGGSGVATVRVNRSSGGGSGGSANTGHPVTSTGSVTYPGPTVGNPQANQVSLVEIANLDRPLGYKGNYIIFPLRRATYLTTYMLQEFVDSQYGIRDPDELGNWSLTEVAQAIEALSRVNSPSEATAARRQQLIERYVAMLTNPRTTSDEIIVPTGQLFVEALPGRHPLLEDFKLRHRQEDLRRAQTDVRHAELENIRLAARLVAGERNDPQVERRILVDPQLSGPTGWWPCMPGPLGKPGETELDPKEKG